MDIDPVEINIRAAAERLIALSNQIPVLLNRSKLVQIDFTPVVLACLVEQSRALAFLMDAILASDGKSRQLNYKATKSNGHSESPTSPTSPIVISES